MHSSFRFLALALGAKSELETVLRTPSRPANDQAPRPARGARLVAGAPSDAMTTTSDVRTTSLFICCCKVCNDTGEWPQTIYILLQ